MSVTVRSPVDGFTGRVGNVEFRDGAATVADDDHQALAYFRRHGYGLSGSTPAAAPEPPDPRHLGEGGSGTVPVGTRLRDAAVDPEPGDFLPPVNAGEANPHGPAVVSPGIHAAESGRPVVPGPVSRDAAEQQEKESAAAATTQGQAPVAAPPVPTKAQPPPRKRKA